MHVNVGWVCTVQEGVSVESVHIWTDGSVDPPHSIYQRNITPVLNYKYTIVQCRFMFVHYVRSFTQLEILNVLAYDEVNVNKD